MTQPTSTSKNNRSAATSARKDGQIINVKVEVPSDGSLWDEELIDAALMMIQQSYPGAQWIE